MRLVRLVRLVRFVRPVLFVNSAQFVQRTSSFTPFFFTNHNILYLLTRVRNVFDTCQKVFQHVSKDTTIPISQHKYSHLQPSTNPLLKHQDTYLTKQQHQPRASYPLSPIAHHPTRLDLSLNLWPLCLQRIALNLSTKHGITNPSQHLPDYHAITAP